MGRAGALHRAEFMQQRHSKCWPRLDPGCTSSLGGRTSSWRVGGASYSTMLCGIAWAHSVNRPRRSDPNTSPDHSIGRSDGRCVQRAGTWVELVLPVRKFCVTVPEHCVVLVYQVSDLSAWDLVVVIVAQKVKDACIEDERQNRAPHLPAGLLIAAMIQVGSSHVS
ncbi:thioredoxin superfamily protein [Dorcoceras hygrometricum]|uniref:Thioredoxin superfamily protein n=1 Tax=Dorcoceras hygrometricum TaxID=472368 RepID=A0A2Z7AKP5_9LAMI|nr:thioredoxin superfamily protein [Dorcoceras hygrometricum]